MKKYILFLMSAIFLYSSSLLAGPIGSGPISGPEIPITHRITLSAGNITVTTAQMNSTIFMTAAGEVQVPDVCDSDTGQWLIVMNKTDTNQVEVAVVDTANDMFVLIDGTVLDVDDEIDLSTNPSSWVKIVCYEANTWYIVSGVGVTTDGGAAD
jgi:hypothetical protein